MIAGTSVLLLSVTMAVAAGLVGCFALMRRMTLASDALSHVALPGIGLALVFSMNPVVGGVAALFLGTVVVWAIEHRTRMSTETVIGVVFSAALAVGTMTTSGEELIDALVGGAGSQSLLETILGLLGALAVITFVVTQRHRLVLALVSREIARTAGIHVERLDFAFLLGFAITIALGLRYLGVLLMGSLVIIPAATAKQVARGLGPMLAVAVVLAVIATVGGGLIAAHFHRASGPVIIVLAAAFFFASLVARRPAQR